MTFDMYICMPEGCRVIEMRKHFYINLSNFCALLRLVLVFCWRFQQHCHVHFHQKLPTNINSRIRSDAEHVKTHDVSFNHCRIFYRPNHNWSSNFHVRCICDMAQTANPSSERPKRPLYIFGSDSDWVSWRQKLYLSCGKDSSKTITNRRAQQNINK